MRAGSDPALAEILRHRAERRARGRLHFAAHLRAHHVLGIGGGMIGTP